MSEKPTLTTEALVRARPVLNMAGIARAAGIPEQTLFAKLRRGSPLSDDDARSIEEVLRAADLQLTG